MGVHGYVSNTLLEFTSLWVAIFTGIQNVDKCVENWGKKLQECWKYIDLILPAICNERELPFRWKSSNLVLGSGVWMATVSWKENNRGKSNCIDDSICNI